jgi:DNA polymerase-3 subunit epsilon
MVDPQAGIPRIGIPEIVPEGVDSFGRMTRPQRVGPALIQQTGVGRPHFRREQRIVDPPFGFVDIEVRRHDVEIAGEDDRRRGREQRRGMRQQSVEPGQLVGECRSGTGIAVGQIEAGNEYAVHRRFDVATLVRIGIVRQSTPCLDRCTDAAEDRDTVPALLAMPDGFVSRRLDRCHGKLFVGHLELLKADDGGICLRQPTQQDRQPTVNAVHIVGRDFHQWPTRAVAGSFRARQDGGLARLWNNSYWSDGHAMFRSMLVDIACPSNAVSTARPGDAPDFVVIDVETACARISSICQVGIVGFRDGRETFAYETLVNPRDHFSPFNVKIHGICPDHVVGHPDFSAIHNAVRSHLSGRITVAHSYFDKGALAAACRVHDRPTIEATWLDSVRVAKRAWPELASHRLNNLSRYLGLDHRHHDALSDARAAGMVVIRAIDHTGIELPGWLSMSAVRQNPAPKPAPDGPLVGERVAILGSPRDGALAHWIARAGGRVVSTVGVRTTLLVVSIDQPFGKWVNASELYQKADALKAQGQAITIIEELELRARYS